MSSCQHFSFPPLSAECAQYIIMPDKISDNPSQIKIQVTQLKKIIDFLEEMKKKVEQKLEKISKHEFQYDISSIPNHFLYKNRFFFYKWKLYRLHKKHYDLEAEIYANLISVCNSLIVFYKACLGCNYPAKIFESALRTNIEQSLNSEQNPTLKHILFKIRCLEHLVQNPQNFLRHSPITQDEFEGSLEGATLCVNENVKICPLTKFDDVLLEYLLENNLFHLLSDAADQIDVTQKKAQNVITPVIRQIVQTLNVTGKSYKSIIKLSLRRILFDQFYIKHPMLDVGNNSITEFLTNCEKFRALTPKQVQVPPDLLPENYYEQPFYVLFSDSPHTKAIARNFTNLMFITNPFDFAATTFELSQKIEQFLLYLRHSDKLNTNLAFDEFLLLLCAALSCFPPLNAIQIQQFMSFFDKIPMGQGLKFFAISLPAALDQIKQIVREFDK